MFNVRLGIHRNLVLLGFMLLIGVNLGAQNRIEGRLISPGSTVSSRFSFDDDEWTRQVFRIEVPQDAVLVKLLIKNADLDVDLHISKRGRLDDLSDADFISDDILWNETLELSPYHDEGFEPGTWFVYLSGHTPTLAPKDPKGVFSISYELVQRPSNPITLIPGQASNLRLSKDTGMCGFFTFNLPTQGPWRLDVSQAQMDLDIFVKKDTFPGYREDADFKGISLLAREWIVVETENPGVYKGILLGSNSEEHPESVSILLTLGTQVPTSLTLPTPSTATVFSADQNLGQVLAATVEVKNYAGSGSGVIIHPQGLILTNYHVVEGSDSQATSRVYVAVTTEPGKPPIEGWLGRVVAFDKIRDLALVQVVEDLWGRKLTQGLTWPFLRPQRQVQSRFGDSLWVSGFPALGGSGSRVSLTLSRGIISGWEDTWFGTILKTDAEINSGNSGGPVIDQSGKLVGLATAVIGEDSGQVGYVHPVGLIPEPWWQWIMDPSTIPNGP